MRALMQAFKLFHEWLTKVRWRNVFNQHPRMHFLLEANFPSRANVIHFCIGVIKVFVDRCSCTSRFQFVSLSSAKIIYSA